MDYSGYQRKAMELKKKRETLRFLTVEDVVKIFDAVPSRTSVTMPVKYNVLTDQVRDELRSKGIGHFMDGNGVDIGFFKMTSVDDIVRTFICFDNETQDELLIRLQEAIESKPEWLD